MRSLRVISLVLLLATCIHGREYRTITGQDNCLLKPRLGSAHSMQGRFCKPGSERYLDGVGEMYRSPLVPSARAISNEVHGMVPRDPYSSVGASEMFTLYGQFITHDLGWTPAANTSVSGGKSYTVREGMFIPVPKCDKEWDIKCTGSVSIPAWRASTYPTPPGKPREYENQINSWIDGSVVYGNDADRQATLRSFKNGKMKTTIGPGGDFPPFNLNNTSTSNDA
eukprot:TRINITY_DN5814_c0_g1_i2.p1 TRINITY_DN5814_c0_g1~~TRINITY_DN5814_c0_g1_i2.p1  ORF type:complete len:225 (+),score=39.60 TRINITY_DN5814_c0_g1_i2:1-675(+)